MYLCEVEACVCCEVKLVSGVGWILVSGVRGNLTSVVKCSGSLNLVYC